MEAPPAFLLDSRRFPRGKAASPGQFDNRWMVFPQDFPSGKLLLSRGLRRAVVVREGPLMDDLAHVLRRWQEAGVRIEEKVATEPGGARTVFGPVDRYCVEDDSGDRALEFGYHQGRLTTREHSLSPAVEISASAS